MKETLLWRRCCANRGYATGGGGPAGRAGGGPAVGCFPVVSQFGFDQGFDLFDDLSTGLYEDLPGGKSRTEGRTVL